MSDDDNVPPLEDLSHAFKSLATAAGPANATSAAAGVSPSPAAATAQKVTVTGSPQKESKPPAMSPGRQVQASPSSFGGMRSGFLTSQQKKPRQKPSATSANSDAAATVSTDDDDGLPFIRANPEAAAKSLRLDEVQDTMRSSSAAGGILSGDRSWITDDLLAKIESNPDLLRRLADPRMSAALAKFQANPAAAMAEFANDAEVQAFLKDFAAILGDHFTQIAEKQEKEAAANQAAEPPPDPEVAEVLSRPGVREALTNADVQRWLSMAKTDPDRAQVVLRSSRDPEFQGRIRLLFENGLLGIAK